MEEEFDDFFGSDEYQELVNRYEDMRRNKQQFFFDVVEFENIIDYYIDINKANQALDAVQYASKLHPSSITLQMKKAQVFLDKGNFRRALEILNEVERIEFQNSDVYLLKGMALNVAKRYSDAEQAFDNAVEYAGDEERLDMLQNIAFSFEHLGRYNQALKYLHQARELDPKNLLILYDLGYCYERMGDREKSITLYKSFLDGDPFSENGWYNLANLYYRLERFRESIDAYEFALAINPDLSIVYFNLANARVHMEQYEKAIADYKKFIEYDGENSEVEYYMGDCYENLNDFEQAIQHYRNSTRYDEEYANGYYGLASALYEKGDNLEALTQVNKAISIEDDNADFLYLKGNIYYGMGDFRGALKPYKQAYKINSDDYDFIIALVDAHLSLNQYDEAAHLLLTALDKKDKFAIYHYRLSSIYFKAGNPEKALFFAEEGLKTDRHQYPELFTFNADIYNQKELVELIQKYTD